MKFSLKLIFCLFVVLPGLANAVVSTNFATGNGNKDTVNRGFCNVGDYISGLNVKEQGGFGIIDIMLKCEDSSGNSRLTGKWIVNNRASGVEITDTCFGNQVTGMTAREQGGFGVVDIKLLCGDSVMPNFSTANEGITLNGGGADQSPISCPAGRRPIGIEVNEQFGYGVVNFKLLCN